MDISSLGGGRVQFLQAQLFPTCTLTPATAGGRGFLGSFLSKGLKTNQLEVNTDEKTLRPIARLKEPRDLFALPKDKDHDCAQQAPRWPIECQVIEERITHIHSVPGHPEPYNQPTGNELKPRPVGEENGIVVFNYNPISAVNYDEKKKKKKNNSSSDSDISSSESRGSTPECSTPDKRKLKLQDTFAKFVETLDRRSSSNSSDDEYDEEDDDEDDDGRGDDPTTPKNGDGKKSKSKSKSNSKSKSTSPKDCGDNDEIEDIWASKSPEYIAGTPTHIRNQFGKEVIANNNDKFSNSPRIQRIMPKPISPVRIPDQNQQSKQTKKNKKTQKNADLGLVENNSNINDTSTNNNNNNNNNNKNKNTTSTPPSKSSSSSSSLSTDLTDETPCDDNDNDNDDSMTLREKNTQLFEQDFPLKFLSTTDNENSESSNSGPENEILMKEEIDNNASSASSTITTASNTEINPKNTQRLSAGQQMQFPSSYSSQIDPSNTNDDNNNNNNNIETQNQNKNSTSDTTLLEPQFSRSAVGGSKILTNCHPYNPEEYDGLQFESRFESGNLAKAVMITQTYYELYLRSDLYTSRSRQWFYFRVQKTKRNVTYRFSIVNLVKSDSLYNDGMCPLMYSTIQARDWKQGWRRCGKNICYYRNDDENSADDDDENSTYTLTFNIEFPNDEDTVYFAHSYPYTYSELQDYLMAIQKDPEKSKFCKLRLLCRSLAGNNVYYLTVTSPTIEEELMKKKKSIVVSARVHPSETPSSWMMKGLLDFITGDTLVAKRLRHRFIFKLIPMLNPDGVIVGNTRNSLTGKDLNRQYRTVIRETYPSIWYTKAMIKRLIDECGVTMYCDMHAHSRKHNIFIYGCENKRNPEKKLTEQVFPLMMHKNVADKFSFESCKFKVQRSKEGTGRIVVWMLGITNSYTIEASFGGSSLGSRKGTHFTTADYEQMGRVFCETLLDFGDETPTKERLRLKIIERLLKEGSSAEEPLNIPLTDYSSDEGLNSSSSENEGKGSISFSDLEGPCCQPLKAPPSSPELRKFQYKRMRKIMRELDRIYFQPLFQRKFRVIMKAKKLKANKRKREKREKSKQPIATLLERLAGGQEKLNELVRKSSNQSQISKKNSKETSTERNSVEEDTVEEMSITYKKMRRRSKKKKNKDGSVGVGAGVEGETEKRSIKRHRVKVSRKLRLWLANRYIIIFRQKKNRKIKLRSKSHAHRKKCDARTPLDLPTTDPGSDLFFSTDDEYFADDNNGGVNGASYFDSYGPTVPRTRRILLQSDLQRRYIEEIGDGVSKMMPPELIVTSPSKQTSRIATTNIIRYRSTLPKSAQQIHQLQPQSISVQPTPNTAPMKMGLQSSEYSMIGEPARRTSSWHSLNHNNNSGKTASKYRISNPYQVNATDGNEDLQFKLSLKKKIWTGIQPEQSSNNFNSNRPLSWCLLQPGMPPKQTIKRERNTRERKRNESEEFFAECSQKLINWQQQESTTTVRRQKSRLNMNLLVMPDIQNETSAIRVLKQMSCSTKKVQKATAKMDLTEGGKQKRRKNPVSKISETTQLLTRLGKSKSRNAFPAQRQLNRLNVGGVGGRVEITNTTATTSSTLTICKSSGNKFQPNKFKTGGIVATAVQANPKKLKKVRAHNNKSQHQFLGSGGGGGGTMYNIVTPTPSTNKFNNMLVNSVETTATLARKVKNKIKKKKQPTAAGTTTTMPQVVAASTDATAGRSHALSNGIGGAGTAPPTPRTIFIGNKNILH